MFTLYGSLLGDGSEDAAFSKALLLLVPVSPAFGFAEGNPPRELILCPDPESCVQTRVPTTTPMLEIL
jgi:hypothetical protein